MTTTAERTTTTARTSAPSRTAMSGRSDGPTAASAGPQASAQPDAADHGTIACFTGLVSAAVCLMVLTFVVPVPPTVRMVVSLVLAVGVGAVTARVSQRLEERAAGRR